MPPLALKINGLPNAHILLCAVYLAKSNGNQIFLAKKEGYM